MLLSRPSSRRIYHISSNVHQAAELATLCWQPYAGCTRQLPLIVVNRRLNFDSSHTPHFSFIFLLITAQA